MHRNQVPVHCANLVSSGTVQDAYVRASPHHLPNQDTVLYLTAPEALVSFLGTGRSAGRMLWYSIEEG